MKAVVLAFSLVFFISQSAQAKIKRFGQVEPTLYRGSMLDEESDYAYLRSIGVKTIINLQTTQEKIETDIAYAKKYHMRVVSVPIPSIIFSPRVRDVNRVLNLMADPALRPIYIHCTHGRDRTGMMSALYRVREHGWTPERAYDEWVALGFDDNLFTGTLSNYYWDHVYDL